MSYAAVGDEILSTMASKIKAGTVQLPSLATLAQRAGVPVAPDQGTAPDPTAVLASGAGAGNDLVIFVGLGIAVLAVGGAVLFKMNKAKAK